MWCSMGRYTGRTFVLTLQFSNYKSKHVLDIWVNYVMLAVSKYVFLRVGSNQLAGWRLVSSQSALQKRGET